MSAPLSWTTNYNSFSYVLKHQVEQLIRTSTKKNWKSHASELKNLVNLYGIDIIVFALAYVISESQNAKGEQVIHQLVQALSDKQKLPFIIYKALSGVYASGKPSRDNALLFAFKLLKLPVQQELGVLCALVIAPVGPVQEESLTVLKSKMGTIARNSGSKDGGAVLVNTSGFHSLMFLMQTRPQLFTDENRAAVKQLLAKLTPNNESSLLLYPLLAGDADMSFKAPVKHHRRVSIPLFTKLRASSSVAHLMEDIGYSCAATPDNLRIILSHFAGLKVQDVAHIVGMMSRTHTGLEDNATLHSFTRSSSWSPKGSTKSWNINVFVDTIQELYSNKFHWPQVIQNLDHPDFQLYDARGFALILAVYKRATKTPFPVDALFGVWNNTSAQLSLLKLAVGTSPESFSFSGPPPPAYLDGFPPNIKAAALSSPSQHWFSIPLVKTLLGLSEMENYSLVRLIFDHPIQTCPEILFLSLTQIKKPNALHGELCAALMRVFLSSHSKSAWVLNRVWYREAALNKINRPIMIRGLVQAYAADPSSLPRLLEISQISLKALTAVLETKYYDFSVALATLAKQREFLNLGRWLPHQIQEVGDPFVVACLRFISKRMRRKQDALSQEILAIFLGSIGQHQQHLSAPVIDQFVALQNQLSARAGADAGATPTPQAPAPGGSEPGQQQQREMFPAHIEKWANTLFQQIYTGQLPIEEAIKLLQGFKTGTKEKQDVFACMLHSLFDEFRFFSSYPEKELQITGVLFGQLIQHQLISYIPLGIAFRYVLEALRKPPNTKMFKFGTLALEQFRTRLPEWPQYCQFLAQIPALRQFHPQLTEWIQRALELPAGGQPPGDAVASGAPPGDSGAQAAASPAEPPNNKAHPVSKQPSKSAPRLSEPKKKPSTFSSLPIDMLLQAAGRLEGTEPPEKIKDRIHFIFNNVAKGNIEQKAKEMRALLEDAHQPYLARYFVIKRVAIEPNFHSLYISFLGKLISVLPDLERAVLSEAFRNIKVLLGSGDIISSSAQRTILKNLGSWVGNLTLARNQPLLYDDLCPKKLIVEAFESGKLIVVVPFVAKILACCKESVVFRPPNAWTMAQLRVLVELYQLQDLKLILKFETEVLCNHLGVDLQQIVPTKIFANRPSAPVANTPQVKLNLEAHVHIPPNLPLFQQFPQLPALVAKALDIAIREVIQPVVERSVTIASITTHKLINLDFYTDGDEDKVRNAARLMARSLSGSLAHVTGTDLLRVSLSNHLKALLQSALGEQHKERLVTVIDQAVLLTVQENLELACALVQKAASEGAVRTTEDALAAAFEARSEHRKRGPGTQFLMKQFEPPASLPESLRPSRHGMEPKHLRVYQEFAGIAERSIRTEFRTAPDLDPSTYLATVVLKKKAAPAKPEDAASQASGKSDVAPAAPTPANGIPPDGTVNVSSQGSSAPVESFKKILQELDKIFLKFGDGPVANLPQAEITALFRQIPLLIVQSEDQSQLSVTFAQVLFNRLFENSSPIFSEIQLICLKGVRDAVPLVVNEITKWVLFLEEPHATNKKPIVGLLRFQLLKTAVYDAHLAKLLTTQPKKSIFELAFYLVRTLCIEGRFAAAMAAEFKQTIAALHSLRSIDGVSAILEQIPGFKGSDVQAAARPKQVAPDPLLEEPVAPEMRDLVQSFFKEWATTYSKGKVKGVDGASAALRQQRPKYDALLRGPNLASIVRVCADSVVQSVYQVAPGSPVWHKFVDMLTPLLELLVRQPLPAEEQTQPKLMVARRLHTTLQVLMRLMARDHQVRGPQFRQRVYYRILTALLVSLNASDIDTDESDDTKGERLRVALVFSEALQLVSPERVPGFLFGWLGLMAHRAVMPPLLFSQQQGWPQFERLLVKLLRFQEPFLRDANLVPAIQALYKGTLRILLVLLHDFPEFLSEYHFSFCDVIPRSCVQMRNVILSAFPRSLHLPDPFRASLKVDRLPEITQPPRIRSDYLAVLNQRPTFLAALNEQLLGNNATFLRDFGRELFLSSEEAALKGTRFNVPLINALIFHAGITSIKLQTGAVPSPLAHPASAELFQRLVTGLDPEGRYIVVSAIVNHLRFPNKQTYFFSCLVLYLFVSNKNNEDVQEAIARVLLERLIANRPHAWGSLVTFIELLRNDSYGLTSCTFTRCAPEIIRLFESVEGHIREIG